MTRRAVLIGAVMAAAVCSWSAGAGAADPVIPAGREAEVVKVIAPYRLGDEVADGFLLNGIQIKQHQIDLVLARKTDPSERVTLALMVRSGVRSSLGWGSAYELSVNPAEEQQSAPARRAIAKLKEVVAHNADGAFWDRVLTVPDVGVRGVPGVGLPRRAPLIVIGGLLLMLAVMAMRSHAATQLLGPMWRRRASWRVRAAAPRWSRPQSTPGVTARPTVPRGVEAGGSDAASQSSRAWAAPMALAATAVAVPLLVWLITQSSFGTDDPEALSRYRQSLQRECARWSLWVACAACGAALILTLARAALEQARGRFSAATALALDAAGVLAWSAVVRFVLTEPNILTDGGSGYGRLWRLQVGGWQGFSVLIEALFPAEPRFMWTVIRVPWVLAALAPPLLLLLARALGFGRAVALFAGIALASLPLHAAMYSSDFEFGPLLTFNLLGLGLVAAAVRFERGELAAAGAAVLAYTCWGRPDAPIVGAALLVVALPALRRWRTQPILVAALGWFALNAVASIASARVLGAGSHIEPHLWPRLPVLRFLQLQPVVPFWLLLPIPLGVAHLVRRDLRRLAVLAVGIVAGLVPLSLSPIGTGDPTRSYMEYFRYGTWALPWIVLVAAEGMDAAVRFMPRAAFAARAAIIIILMATPLTFRSYLATQYGPRVEEAAFREALRRVPADCGVVVPDDDSDDQHGGTIEIQRRYLYIAEEALAQGESRVNPARITGVTPFLRSAADHRAVPPLPDGDRAIPGCWFYFRGSYCYTGFLGQSAEVCADFERRAVLEPTMTQTIFYISHRLVTRPDLRDPPLYDPAQSLVLSRIAGWRTELSDTAALR